MSGRKLNLVVAACNNGGIGVNGTLPWRLKGDMAFFKRITRETRDPGLQNAVIMGRKTWESIPERFRPLEGRVNVVISATWREAPRGAHLADSLDAAVRVCTSGHLAQSIEGLFVIGGSSIYRLALGSALCGRVYYTHVLADFECDTFLPELDWNDFQETKLENVDSSEQEEKDIKYRIAVYDKKD